MKKDVVKEHERRESHPQNRELRGRQNANVQPQKVSQVHRAPPERQVSRRLSTKCLCDGHSCMSMRIAQSFGKTPGYLEISKSFKSGLW